MTNGQLEYRMDRKAQSRTILRCLAFAGSIGMNITLYYSLFMKDAGSERNLQISTTIGLVIAILIFRTQVRAVKKNFNRILKITPDVLELSATTIKNQILFSEIKTAELWLDLQNNPINLSVIGTE